MIENATTDLSSSDQVIRNLAEFDLFCNLDTGREYTGFKGLYNSLMVEENRISTYGIVNNIRVKKNLDKHHLLNYMNGLLMETPSHIIMTSGTFISMNKDLQSRVVEKLKILPERGSPVTLYVGDDDDVRAASLFDGSDVDVREYNRKEHFIIHFIKSKFSFNFVLPHTEDLVIRVDLNSKDFKKEKEENKKRILLYFDELIVNFDKQINGEKRD